MIFFTSTICRYVFYRFASSQRRITPCGSWKNRIGTYAPRAHGGSVPGRSMLYAICRSRYPVELVSVVSVHIRLRHKGRTMYKVVSVLGRNYRTWSAARRRRALCTGVMYRGILSSVGRPIVSRIRSRFVQDAHTVQGRNYTQPVNVADVLTSGRFPTARHCRWRGIQMRSPIYPSM